MKFMNKNKKGFTLVELMIVVVIMAILVAVAVPIFNAVTTNAKIKTCNGNARILSGQINTIVLNEIGGGTDDKQVVVAQELKATTAISALITDSTSSLTFADYLQGKEMPVCPVNKENVYWVQADGLVICADSEGNATDHNAKAGTEGEAGEDD